MGKALMVNRFLHLRRMINIILFLLVIPHAAGAADLNLEKDLQVKLVQSRVILQTISDKLASGKTVRSETARLKAIAEDIRASHLLMQERFRLREEKARSLSSRAQERQAAAADGYRRTLDEYFAVVNSLTPDAPASRSDVDRLQTLLDSILHKNKRPIIGSLPYRNLNYPATEPSAAPAITPAYLGGGQATTPDDVKSTAEAPISTEIANLAQSLGWSPVLIYEYVKNNVETEWYWGCMKGAEDTLRQKSGNDCDQATLLTALLRASGYPTRYVRGTIEFFPDIELAKNLTGLDDPQKVAELFQKAGIPYKPVMNGSVISNIQIEHVWVETFVPYANYRGALIDDRGKTWLGLDTSIKAAGYAYTMPADIVSEYSLAPLRDQYLTTLRTETPLEFIRTKVNEHLAVSHPTSTYTDYLASRTLMPEVLQIIPGNLQFTTIRVTNEYTQIPDDLRHKIQFIARLSGQTTGDPLFDVSLDALGLSNHSIALRYEPETV